ncbi:MAG: hypothetical protein K2Y51_07025 [Gammaproteobacteria bacterium]|nr:hypothetical protein [Gammaproteobacteria bacterium]
MSDTPQSGALAEEAERLLQLADGLAAMAPDFVEEAQSWSQRLRERMSRAPSAASLEFQLEYMTRALRCRWLRFAAARPSAVYRSPTEAQLESLEGDPLTQAYGYERDLRPTALEARCAAFFPRTSPPWSARHLLFSSGQAAMSVALTMLRQRVDTRPLRVLHLGGYFETAALLAEQPSNFTVLADADAASADLLVIEPVACDGNFSRVSNAALARVLATARACRTVIFDTTLVGRSDPLDTFLRGGVPAHVDCVLRVCSGLKLFQQGMELANFGLVGCHERRAPDFETSAALDALERLRTLTGTGLRLADTIALEAPWVLDAPATADYEQAVFANNARLAVAVQARNRLFRPLSHPTLWGGHAPYCVFRLPDDDPADLSRLETHLARAARARSLPVDKGGSFGFRGHRFEVVCPESGEPPFLRVAMGRRTGWSCDGFIELMTEIAGWDSVAPLSFQGER